MANIALLSICTCEIGFIWRMHGLRMWRRTVATAKLDILDIINSKARLGEQGYEDLASQWDATQHMIVSSQPKKRPNLKTGSKTSVKAEPSEPERPQKTQPRQQNRRTALTNARRVARRATAPQLQQLMNAQQWGLLRALFSRPPSPLTTPPPSLLSLSASVCSSAFASAVPPH